MNYKINAVVKKKGESHDPVSDAYGLKVTAYGEPEGKVSVHTDIVLHSRVSTDWFLDYWMKTEHMCHKRVKSCQAMFLKWCETDDTMTFTYKETTRTGCPIVITISKEPVECHA